MMNFLFTKTPLAFLVASFWRDEAFSYLMARLPLGSLLWSTAQDSNPPLYYLFLKIWMIFFGHSELALRSVSLLFFWATIFVTYKILHESIGLTKKTSLWYLLFVILNPLLHYYAFEARMYTMMAFFGTTLFYLLLKKNYRLYAVTALLGLFTHYFLVLILLLHAIYIFILNKREIKSFIRPLIQTLPFYIPWVIFVLFARPPIGEQFWIVPQQWTDILFLPAVLLTGYDNGTWVLFSYLPFLSAVVWGLIFYYFKQLPHSKLKRNTLILLAGWSLGIPIFIYVISFWKPVFLPRYLIFSSVAVTILIIYALEIIKNKYFRYGILSLIVVFNCIYARNQIQMRVKAPLKNTFLAIQRVIRKNDVIYVTHEYNFHPAQYYMPKTKVYIYQKTYEELPWYVGKVLIHKENMVTTFPIYPARAFILNDDGSVSIRSSR